MFLMKKEGRFDKLCTEERSRTKQQSCNFAQPMPYDGAAQHGGIIRRNHRQRDFPARNRRGTSRNRALSQEAPFHAGRFEPAAVRRPFDANGCACASPHVSNL
jgi:hypothetical protein